MSDSMVLRKAELADVVGMTYVLATAWITDFPNTSYGITEDDIRSIDFKNQMAQWQHVVVSPTYKTWVVTEGENVLAFASVRTGAESDELTAIYVLPEHQQRGLGSKLIKQVFKAADHNKLHACIFAFNGKAADFLKTHGFRLDASAPVLELRLPTGKYMPQVWFMKRRNKVKKTVSGDVEMTKVPPAITTAPTRTAPQADRKKDPRKVEKLFVGRSELSDISGETEATIKHYTEYGILLFRQHSKRGRRQYELKPSLARLKEIKKLREQGLQLEDIKIELNKK